MHYDSFLSAWSDLTGWLNVSREEEESAQANRRLPSRLHFCWQGRFHRLCVCTSNFFACLLSPCLAA